MNKVLKTKSHDPLEQLIGESFSKTFPKVGDFIKGMIISIGKNEVIIDIPGLTTGVVRGWELEDESGQMSNLKLGEEVQATVLDLENERGMMELSFRVAGHRQAWDNLIQLKNSHEAVAVKALEANKGGLIVELGKVLGFLPVSQLNSEHYPRVEGGNKNKILEKLKQYIGQEFQVKLIDIDETEEKLIVSEKAVAEAQQVAALAGYEAGDDLEVKVSGIVDFGLFVAIPVRRLPADPPASPRLDLAERAAGAPASVSQDEAGPSVAQARAMSVAADDKHDSLNEEQALEGLIHISEISWQRVEDLHELYQVGDTVRAKIIDISNAKVSLSIKRLLPDPWQDVHKHYQVGQRVKGKVVKLNDFGAFVELDHNIHGLAHISELPTDTAKSQPAAPALPRGRPKLQPTSRLGGQDESRDGHELALMVNEIYEFEIINMEPAAHRLGLSRKVLSTEEPKEEQRNKIQENKDTDKSQ